MWEIFWEDQCEDFDNPDEVLGRIEDLHLKYQNEQAQFIDIVFKRKTFIKIGIGDKLNRSMIFYRPYDSSKDCKMSFNPSMDVEDETKVDIFAPSETFRYLLERNLIGFKDVLDETKFFLNNKELSSSASMYSW